MCQQAPPAPQGISRPANGETGKLVVGVALILFAVFVPTVFINKGQLGF